MIQIGQNSLAGGVPSAAHPTASEARLVTAADRAPTSLRAFFGRWLGRWFVTSIPTAVLLLIGLIAAEHLAPEDLRPTTLIGGAAGHLGATRIETELEATRAQLSVVNTENARLQNSVASWQGRVERLNKYYDTLYARTMTMAQMMSQVEQQYMTTRQSMLNDSESANMGMANLADIVAAFAMATGDEKLMANAHVAGQAMRQQALQTIDAGMKQGMTNAQSMIDTWTTDLPAPPTIDRMIADDPNAEVTPEAAAPPPEPPSIYRRKPKSKP